MFFSGHGLDWERDGRDWPNREASRFVAAAGLRWHVQIAGSGPILLLLHGTGASTHSFRDLLAPLAERFTVVTPDLPGHGFTELPPGSRLSLPGMAALTRGLLDVLMVEPAIVAGHSAGAAIGLRMALDRSGTDAGTNRDSGLRGVVSLNGALMPFEGAAGRWFSPLAKLMVLNPFTPRLFAWKAGDPATIRRLLEGTGSRIGDQGAGYYRLLASDPKHVSAALGMMANWDLRRLVDQLPLLEPPLLLVAGENDATVSPEVSRRIAEIVPGARFELQPGLGHLAHEEDPGATVAILLRSAAEWGVLADG
jgi:magnesium chelatase accessory protein